MLQAAATHQVRVSTRSIGHLSGCRSYMWGKMSMPQFWFIEADCVLDSPCMKKLDHRLTQLPTEAASAVRELARRVAPCKMDDLYKSLKRSCWPRTKRYQVSDGLWVGGATNHGCSLPAMEQKATEVRHKTENSSAYSGQISMKQSSFKSFWSNDLHR